MWTVLDYGNVEVRKSLRLECEWPLTRRSLRDRAIVEFDKNEAPRSDAASAVRTVHWTTRVSNDLSNTVHGLTSASDEGEGESEEDTLAWH